MSAIFYAGGSRRARIIYGAFAQGMAKHGLNLEVMHADNYTGVQAEVAVFYGLIGNLKKLYHDYNNAGKTTIFFDLGYWGRHDEGRYYGYHRIAINALHASVRKVYKEDRLKKFNLEVAEPKRSGEYIIMAGQSAKAAWVYDMEPEEWERKTIQELRSLTEREIYYHPKISWREAKPIEGTIYWPESIEPLLANAWALVTHHSNSSLLALAKGVPIYTVDGIAKTLSMRHLDQIESPRYATKDEVLNLLSGAAYQQWRIDEIANGDLLSHLRTEGVDL